MEKLQVLLSVMNFKNKEEFLQKVKENNIRTDVICINQVSNKEEIFNYKDKNKEIYSYEETGASKSRNRLLKQAIKDICILADDDMIYKNNYEEIIKTAFEQNSNADMIIFNINNLNKNREKFKKIRSKKINRLDIMKIRTSQIAFRNKSLKRYNVKFDEMFGPGEKFNKGEETIFLSDCLKSGMNIISVNQTIGDVLNEESSWFTGFNEKFLYDQGAIFARIYPKMYYIFILQYIIRKYNLYKKNLNIFEAYKQMVNGSKEYKNCVGDKYVRK